MRLRLLFPMLITCFCAAGVNAQIMFAEDCFVGGVTVAGAGNRGVNYGIEADIRWKPEFVIRTVYAVTYRYGWVEPHAMSVNDGDIYWDSSSQVGPETPLTNPYSHPFAVHVKDVTSAINIEDSIIRFDFPPQLAYQHAWNWGWWSIYLVVLYESPSIINEVCFRLNTADQRQDMIQNYYIDLPDYDPSKDFILSTFGANIANLDMSGSTVWFNGDTLGEVVGSDLTNPPTLGVQGHFFYENSIAQGLNGDTVNESFRGHDAVAILNNLIIENQPQLLQIKQSYPLGDSGSNPHPAFTLVYTPSCPVIASDAMPRSYTLCRGDSVVLQGVEGFEHYAWSPDIQLSDSTAMSPTCLPDSSRWYRLRMWNDDPAQGCPLTIPVWVEVGDIPRPPSPVAVASSCPNATGRIRLENPPGLAPFVYGLDSISSAQPVFDQVAAGSHAVSVVDARGCRWDSTLTVPLKPAQQAALQANPTSGLSPLTVAMLNQSSGATSHYWMVDGETFSQAHATTYTFADTGTYALSVVAVRDVFSCADTATIIIRVEQGMQVIMPNIFTPNGDGANDVLLAQVLGARDLQWEVYNRWGALMHRGAAQPEPLAEELIVLWSPEQAAPNTGSGRSPSPEDVPSDGSYILILNAEDLAGRVERMQFVVQLKR